MASSAVISAEAKQFAAKTARSIAEIQQSVNNLADVVVFLEVLGYDEALVRKKGFASMLHLAEYIYNFIDAYDDKDKNASEKLPVPNRARRIAEGLSIVFPWLGALILLFVTGVSLWMAWGLPRDVTAMFLGGVFLGLIITEGLIQVFQRNFAFYYSQTNIGEVKRSIKRSYALAGIILLIAVSGIYFLSNEAGVPFELASIAAISTVTVALHRLSFVIIYVLKKLLHLTISYVGAFVALGLVFFLMPPVISDLGTRYFAALGAAFAVLSGFAVYHHFRVMTQSSTSIVARGAPHFYSPLTVNDSTIVSRFGIQLWESLPYFIYGSSYFIILFADRLLSWIFNPIPTTTAYGTALPISFNSVYHIGADTALLVMLPAIIIQYVLASPVYLLVHNRSLNLKISEKHKIDLYLRRNYWRLLAASITASIFAAGCINYFAPEIMNALGGNETSSRILIFASVGAVFVTVFGANSLYMIFLGRLKGLAVIGAISAAIVVLAGWTFATYFGFESIVMAYLAGAMFSAVTSTIFMTKTLRKASSWLFARYI